MEFTVNESGKEEEEGRLEKTVLTSTSEDFFIFSSMITSSTSSVHIVTSMSWCVLFCAVQC